MAAIESPDQHSEDGDAAANSTPSEQPEAEPGPKGEESDPARPDRLRSYSVVLITLIAALGAIITWQAEVAATSAAELTQRGIVVAINLAAQQNQDRAQAMGEAADVMRVQQLLDERNMLQKQLVLTPSGHAKALLNTEYSVAYYVAEWQLRNDWQDNSYIGDASAPVYNIGRRTSELVAESRTPTDSGAFFAGANREQHKRRDLLLLDVGLIIGLSCATVAHLLRRGRLQTFCAAAGTASLALGIVALLIVKV
jgi:hypothetical protein